MSTLQEKTASPLATSADPTQENALPSALINFSFALAVVGAILFYLLRLPLLALTGLPLLLCGLRHPKDLLLAAIALSPFTFSLTGESYAGTGGNSAMFSISDVLLLLAVPGLLLVALRHKTRVLLGKITLPLLLYLTAGLLSYALNVPHMHGLAKSYFMGFVRTAQMILLIPLFFAVEDWSEDDLRRLFRGYLFCCLFLSVLGMVAFAAGMRDGLFLLGGQKNTTGLTLAIGIMIALSALLPPKGESRDARQIAELTGLARWFLILTTVLCCISLVLGLSRSAFLGLFVGLLYLCWQRRRMLVCVAILVGFAFAALIVHPMLPASAELNVTNFEPNRYSNKQRFTYIQRSLQRFKENPVLGDGFRSRKDYLPHSLEVTLLAEGGLVGLALFAWALVIQLQLLYRATRDFGDDPVRAWVSMTIFICSLAILMQAQFDPYWRRGPLIVTWAGMGIVLSMMRNRKQLEPPA